MKSIDEKKIDVVLGIDFGSSSSTVSYCKDGKIETIQMDDESDKKTLPTVVAFDEKGKIRIGLQALDLKYEEGCMLFQDLKRKILYRSSIKHFGRQIRVQYLVSQILRQLKKRVQLRLGTPVKKAVLTTPAFFSQQLKTILKDSAQIAGLEVLRIINEPTAAALYYLHKNPSKKQTCLFIDMGGQTLDFAVCEVSKNIIDVESSFGDSSCGYNMVDQQIYNQLVKQIFKTKDTSVGQRFQQQGMLKQMLMDVAQQIKIKLANLQSEEYVLNKRITLGQFDYFFEFKMDKRLYSKCHSVYFQKFKQTYASLLRYSRFKQNQIDACVLVGGPINSFFLRDLLAKVVHIPMCPNFENITAVSKGAALYGYKLLYRNQILLSDVLPLSIGVETENGVFQKILESNFKVPCCRRAQFTTSEDFQTGALIRIIEGERAISKHCTVLGEIFLNQIEFGFRGVPVIDLYLQVDQNGIIHAFAKDSTSQKQKRLTIRTPNRLTALQIEQIKQEAEKYRVEDTEYIKRMKATSEINHFYEYCQKLYQRYLEYIPQNLAKKCTRVLTRTSQKLNYVQKLSLEQIQVLHEDLKNLVAQINAVVPKAQIKRR